MSRIIGSCATVFAFLCVLLTVSVLVEAGRKNERRKVASEIESSSDRRDVVDPHKTWLSFVRNQQSRNSQTRKPRMKQRTRKMHLVEGPTGPPGPVGPPGAPGAQITEATMMVQFRSMVRETAARRSERFAGQSFGLLAAGVPDVLSGFYVEMAQRIDLPRKKKREMHNFQASRMGSFMRGNGMNFLLGRFTIPFTAVYQFQATLHIQRPHRDLVHHRRDMLTLQICTNGDCYHNAGLKAVAGMATNSKLFTVTVQGILYLMANNYVSVFVENSSPSTVFVTESSSFSGILMGA